MADLPLVMILVGGLGLRLRSVTGDRPKALAETGGNIFLDIQLQWLATQGSREVVLLTGHRAEEISDFVRDGSQWGLNVCCLQESTPLGTGGALLNAVKELKLRKEFLLLNGDSLTEVSLMDFSSEFELEKELRIVVVKQDDISLFGNVEFDNSKRLCGFREKSLNTGEGWINSGIYYFPRDWFPDLPDKIQQSSLELDLIPRWLSESRSIRVFQARGNFIDIGTPSSFKQFQKQICFWINKPLLESQ